MTYRLRPLTLAPPRRGVTSSVAGVRIVLEPVRSGAPSREVTLARPSGRDLRDAAVSKPSIIDAALDPVRLILAAAAAAGPSTAKTGRYAHQRHSSPRRRVRRRPDPQDGHALANRPHVRFALVDKIATDAPFTANH